MLNNSLKRNLENISLFTETIICNKIIHSIADGLINTDTTFTYITPIPTHPGIVEVNRNSGNANKLNPNKPTPNTTE